MREASNRKAKQTNEEIYERRQKGETYASIGKDNGVHASAIRGIYMRVALRKRQDAAIAALRAKRAAN